MKAVHIKRIYDDQAKADGYRVLVDRLWPRGISKQSAALDEWAKEIAPSAQLRKAYHDEAISWPQFRARYRAELRECRAELAALTERAGSARITLLTATRDRTLNHAIVLKEAVEALHRRSPGKRASRLDG